MQYGTNGINVLTVCKLAQALADFMHLSDKSVVFIGYDTRHNSKEFANAFAKTLDYNNIKCILSKDYIPTPVCVYATKKYEADFGVMITASHNKKEYNGIKIYDNEGISISKITQQAISDIFNKTDEVIVYNNIYKHKMNRCQKVNATDNVKFVDRAYKEEKKSLNVVYTPLNGTGLFWVTRLLNRQGFTLKVTTSQKRANGDFMTCPYPNPEFENVFYESVKLAKKLQSDIIIATDPDADRLGVMARHDGKYVKISGNELGYIFADYLLSGSVNKFVVTTVVTSPLIDNICKHHGAEVHKTLTGFLSIGTKMKCLIKQKGREHFALAYEESAGYVVRDDYYDKDGIYASLLICQIAEWLKQDGKTLIDYLNDIYLRCGYIAEMSDSVQFGGSDAIDQMQNKINHLRANPIHEIMGEKVEEIKDYLLDATGLEKQNFIEYHTQSFTFILRPSGTEPKLKIYAFCRGEREDADEKVARLVSSIKELYFE